MARPLDGVSVLVTRPAAQAEGLCRLIEQAGGRAERLPAIEIVPVSDSNGVRGLLGETWDLIICISSNAVRFGLPLFPEGCFPVDAKLAAVGGATARALTAAGRAPDLVPAERFDSEGLLALPELQHMSGRRVLILRGVGGRELLAEQLRARGAEVAYAEVYRRRLPSIDTDGLRAHWDERVQVVTTTSDEGLRNLCRLLGAPDSGEIERAPELLRRTPLVVVSQRGAAGARGLGIERVTVADRAADHALLAAVARSLGRAL